jgi:hypothetical protein
VFGVPVEIVSFVDGSQPGWVECRLTDAHGRLWVFVEKVPVVTEMALDASSRYPQPGVIACEVIRRDGGFALVDTARPWGVESFEGETQFEIQEDSLIEW